MAETCGKLRSDLEIRPESADVNSGVIVKDPIVRRFYRFTPVQATALELLDGQRDITSIALSVSEKHQTTVLEQQLEDFVGKLKALLLLDHPFCWAKLETHGRSKHRLLSSLLSIKIHAFNPDKLLTDLEKKLSFCFSPIFTLFAWSVIAIAVILLILNWDSLFVSLRNLFSLYSVPLIIIVAFTIMTIHEFAHGLTLKHFGGKVDEMGFLFLYFIPALYCNVNDAWMLKKRERILVTLAGGYIQLFIWAMAIIAWRLLSPETLASRICAIIIAFAGIQAILNFNPLLRLDGYYLLSDLLGIPNLRTRAFVYLKNKLEALVVGATAGSEVAGGRREKRIYFWYGTASFLFTIAIVWIVFRRLGGWMIREYQAWGVLLITTLFLMAVPILSKGNVTASRKLLGRISIRSKKTPRILIVLILIILAGLLPWELKISGDFTVLPTRKVLVTPQVEGNLKAIYVDQGSRVSIGEILAEIENLELANNYEETKGELSSRRATLDLLKAGTRPEEIERAKRLVETKKAELSSAARIEEERTVLLETIAKKEAELANAKLNYERTQSLLESGLIARNEVDRNRTAYEVQKKELLEAMGMLRVLEERRDRTQDVKRKELAQAESELRILLAGAREESIREVDSQVKKLEEKLNILKRELDHLSIRSPIEGLVATSYLANRIGEYLDKGDVFCEIVSEGTMVIDMPVPEKEIGDVKLGFPIILKVRGYPRRSYEAHVKSIAPVALANGSIQYVLVQGELKNPDGSLKAGMTGVGKIFCGKRMIIELLTRRAIRWLRTEFWEYLP